MRVSMLKLQPANKSNKNFLKQGFTFIEILVVTVLIGVLAALIVVSYTYSLRNSRDARRKADLQNLQVALEAYKQAYGTYPPALSELLPDYINQQPLDPKTGAGYTYEYNSATGTYTIEAALENNDDPYVVSQPL